MRDVLIVIGLSASLALLVTAYIATLYGLLVRAEWTKLITGIFFPPLAAHWAFATRMPVRGLAMLLGAIGYFVSAVLALSAKV